jgi:hypothetical protein
LSQFYANNQITAQTIEDDERLQNLDIKTLDWLNNISEEHRAYFLTLLKHFKYYDRRKIAQGFQKVFEEFKLEMGDLSATAYLKIGSKGGIFNGADEVFPIFRRAARGINKAMAVSSPRDFYDANKKSLIKRLVLVDDIIGSGTTYKNYLEHLTITCPELVAGKDIYVISFVLLPKGKNYLDSIGVHTFFCNSLEKAFENTLIFSDRKTALEVRKKIEVYEEGVSPVVNNKKKAVRGYKQTEGLVAFFHNTPNNTLASFWAPSTEEYPWAPLFPREESGEGFLQLEDMSNPSLEKIQKNKRSKNKLLDIILNLIGRK